MASTTAVAPVATPAIAAGPSACAPCDPFGGDGGEGDERGNGDNSPEASTQVPATHAHAAISEKPQTCRGWARRAVAGGSRREAARRSSWATHAGHARGFALGGDCSGVWLKTRAHAARVIAAAAAHILDGACFGSGARGTVVLAVAPRAARALEQSWHRQVVGWAGEEGCAGGVSVAMRGVHSRP